MLNVFILFFNWRVSLGLKIDKHLRQLRGDVLIKNRTSSNLATPHPSHDPSARQLFHSSGGRAGIPFGPGTFHILNLGCLSNRADGNRITASMLAAGWVWGQCESADLIIVMTCGYSSAQQTESAAAIKQVSSTMKLGARLWVGGCLPSINSSLFEDVRLERCFSPREVEELASQSANLHPVPTSISGLPEGAHLIRIATGCNYNCSYCVIRKATGSLRSRPLSEIVDESLGATQTGARFLYLVSEDVGGYGRDAGTTILDLVKEINTACGVKTRLLLGSIHPQWLIRDVQLFVRLFQCESVVKKASIPIQSGSNRILRLMNRHYSVAEIETALAEFLNGCPDCELATDLIVGFPGESLDDFYETLGLLQRWAFASLDAFIFDAHPGTAAYLMPDQLDVQEKHRRHQELCLEFTRKYLRQKDINSEAGLRAFLADPSSFIPLNTNLSPSVSDEQGGSYVKKCTT